MTHKHISQSIWLHKQCYKEDNSNSILFYSLFNSCILHWEVILLEKQMLSIIKNVSLNKETCFIKDERKIKILIGEFIITGESPPPTPARGETNIYWPEWSPLVVYPR